MDYYQHGYHAGMLIIFDFEQNLAKNCTFKNNYNVKSKKFSNHLSCYMQNEVTVVILYLILFLVVLIFISAHSNSIYHCRYRSIGRLLVTWWLSGKFAAQFKIYHSSIVIIYLGNIHRRDTIANSRRLLNRQLFRLSRFRCLLFGWPRSRQCSSLHFIVIGCHWLLFRRTYSRAGCSIFVEFGSTG
jgi:hypothetical protein